MPCINTLHSVHPLPALVYEWCVLWIKEQQDTTLDIPYVNTVDSTSSLYLLLAGYLAKCWHSSNVTVMGIGISELFLYKEYSLKFICSLCSFFYIPPVNKIIWFLFFFIWFISLSMPLSRSIHIVSNSNTLSFL